MSSNSRRAFLMGRRTLRTPWENFCRRLSRAVSGTFYEFGVHDGVGSARLTLGQAADVHHPRELCTEYGVVLALAGVAHAGAPDEFPVLWAEPGRQMAPATRLAAHSPNWLFQPWR